MPNYPALSRAHAMLKILKAHRAKGFIDFWPPTKRLDLSRAYFKRSAINGKHSEAAGMHANYPVLLSSELPSYGLLWFLSLGPHQLISRHDH